MFGKSKNFPKRVYKEAIKRASEQEWHYIKGYGYGFTPVTRLYKAERTNDALRLRARLIFGRRRWCR